jgi:hypothetical protein
MSTATPPDDPTVQMLTYPRRSQARYLEALKQKTKVPKAALVREALDLLMDKHGDLSSYDG